MEHRTVLIEYRALLQEYRAIWGSPTQLSGEGIDNAQHEDCSLHAIPVSFDSI